MKKIRVKQVKSSIGKTMRQKRTLRALGIKRMNHSVELEASPQILGMVEKVRHLVVIEEL